MAKGQLFATALESLRKSPGRHGDGGGLFLLVGNGGAASWVVRMQKNGKRRDFGLGSADKLSLADARKARDLVRSQFEAGLDPVIERKKAEGIPTFRKAAALVHAAQVKAWRNGKHNAQWLQTLETYAFPTMGDVLVNRIGRSEILEVLQPIWLTKHETARRVRQRIGAVLDWAYAKSYRETEAPMRAVALGLPKLTAKRGHHAAMPYADVPAFVARLRERETIARLALEFAILTAARSGEVRGATWSEVDLDNAVWSIPASRMKREKPHVVPLSPEAVNVLRRALALRTDDATLCFPGPNSGKALSDMALLKTLRDMGETATAHGFRSAFKDWAGEVGGFPNEWSEVALAHAIASKTEAAYRRGDLLEKRRGMMAAWGDYCGGGRGVALRLVGDR